jgi:hypothetical protein
MHKSQCRNIRSVKTQGNVTTPKVKNSMVMDPMKPQRIQKNDYKNDQLK